MWSCFTSQQIFKNFLLSQNKIKYHNSIVKSIKNQTHRYKAYMVHYTDNMVDVYFSNFEHKLYVSINPNKTFNVSGGHVNFNCKSENL